MSRALETIAADVPGAGRMALHVARPSGGGRRPGVLVLQEAFGVNAHIRDTASRLAAEGFVAAAPELFHRTAQGYVDDAYDFGSSRPHYAAVTTEGLVADLAAAHARLAADPGVDPERCAAIGFCLGGRAAFLAAATLPLRAAVSFYGGGIPPLLGRAPDVRGELLLVWAGKDAHIPPAQAAEIAAALRAAGKPFAQAEFSEADHGFFCDRRAAYRPEPARQAWALALEFLRTRLG